MTQATLLTNENYLIVTSVVSIGVLSGFEYSGFILTVLLITPIIKLLINKVISKQQAEINPLNLDKCASCK